MNLSDLVYIDSTGYHFADYPTFLQWRTEQYQAIYGADVYIDPDSQDGQLIAVQALSDYETAALGASVYNSFSPSTAQGLGLSRVVKINGITRLIPTNSTADVVIVGQDATVITNGVVQDTLDRKWDLPATVTIPGTGTITVVATAQDLGALTAEPNTINKIFTPTLGWQTVNNPAAATVGAAVETDAELRLRQARSTANPSLTVFDGTIGAVSNLVGVTKIRGYENDTNATDGNGIPAHSISVVVAGGDQTEIAETIALHKTPGCGTYGTTSQLVYDTNGMPITINFYRPTQVVIKAEITVVAGTGWSVDFVTLIQQAVADTINAGLIGNTVQITKLYAPAYLTGTPQSGTFDISLLRIAKLADAYGTINVPLTFIEQAVCVAATNVTVIVL